MTDPYRIGVDIGGTFTDLVMIDTRDGRLFNEKVLTTPADPSVGVIVCECTNLTPYSYEIKQRLGVPVFDMVTLVHWFHRALRPERFAQD